jgi:uncharacterized DUF497 family protein
VRILWDEPKRRTTLVKHGLDFADLSPDFFENAVVRRVRRDRLQAVGPLSGRLVGVVFLPLGTEAISVISMRYASRKEREIYEAEDPAPDR